MRHALAGRPAASFSGRGDMMGGILSGLVIGSILDGFID
jgi:hypothetical protein